MKLWNTFLLVSVLILISTPACYAQLKADKSSFRLSKTSGSPSYTHFNINKISTFIFNNGVADIDAAGSGSGLFFPKGSRKTSVFTSGFMWAGKVGNEVRAGGSSYITDLQPGGILSNGAAEDTDRRNVRVYRVRPDFKTGVLSSEINDKEGTEPSIRAQYQKDRDEWPWRQGAPFEDLDQDGVYSPGADLPGVRGADQTIWFEANDLNYQTRLKMFQSAPIGIELQATVWGYSGSGRINNMLFKSYRIINKSRTDVDSMYIMIWSDMDIGNASDDFQGCDSTLSLGYCYNALAVDDIYGSTPTAAGFMLLRGPAVAGSPGDSAVYNGKIIHGKKNLPMTSFAGLGRDNIIEGEPYLLIDPVVYYNYMKGKTRFGRDIRLPDSLGGAVTKFPYSGDPVKRTGFIDGIFSPPGDRRIGVNSGPFYFAAGDTQEVVFAEIIAGDIPGVNNLQAVNLLKKSALQARAFYDHSFNAPFSPPAPLVEKTELDRKVVISWGEDQSSISAVEGFNSGGFKFQGYNVYQLPRPDSKLSEGRLTAVFDLIDGTQTIYSKTNDPLTWLESYLPEQFGTDSGIRRYIVIDRDIFTGFPLINGKKYYYAVTAYSYSPDPEDIPNNFESPLNLIEARPQAPAPGIRYSNISGDTVQSVHSSGKSDGYIVPVFINPTAVKGDEYKVTFEEKNDSLSWDLLDVSEGKKLRSNIGNLSGDDNYPITDGIMLKVYNPPGGLKRRGPTNTADSAKWGWHTLSGFTFWTTVNANTSRYPLETFGPTDSTMAIGSAERFWKTTVGYKSLKRVLIRFAATDNNGNITDPGSPWVSYAYRYLGKAQKEPANKEFIPYIKNRTGDFAFQDYNRNFPFAAYDLEVNPPRRLMVGFTENNAAKGLVDGKYWPAVSDSVKSNSEENSPREWFIIFDKDYSEKADPALMVNFLDNQLPVMYIGMPNRRNQFSYNSFSLELTPNHVITSEDVFTFTPKANIADNDLAREDVNNINVFPNPYYGANSEELYSDEQFVTFSHLPRRAVIRIFDLAGQLVKTIDKDSPDQFQRWNLLNEHNYQVASGLFIVHIDMPDIGRTKILKLAVIQRQLIPERF